MMKATENNKIGIVTYFQYNYGSILQCYATSEVLKQKGFQPIVIEKKTNRFMSLVLFCLRCIRYPRYVALFLRKRKESSRKNVGTIGSSNIAAMSRFVLEKMEVMQATEKELLNIGKNQEYMFFLSGSDQIWNGYTVLPSSHYFLQFAPKTKRIAWSPSMGVTGIAIYNRKVYKKYIQEYKMLSAREVQGVQLIKELTGRDAKLLIDPVFLLDREEWARLIGRRTNEAYVFCYFLHPPKQETTEQINAYCEANGVKAVVFGHQYEGYSAIKQRETVEGAPETFLTLIYYAKCVFTDSFHATSFSIILHSSFYCYERNFLNERDTSTRIQTILHMVKMEFALNPQNVLDRPFYDFDFSDERINERRVEMNRYLQDAIDTM